MIKKAEECHFGRIREIALQHLTPEDAEKILNYCFRNKESGLFFVWTENSEIYGFSFSQSFESGTSLDEVFFNGYGIHPIEDYVVLKSGYVDKRKTGEGIGSEMLRHTLERWEEEGINLFYCEVWVKPNNIDATKLIEKIEDSFVVRKSGTHYKDTISGMSEEELERECPGCNRKNKKCQCKGAIYKILK